MIRLALPREVDARERRVALTPPAIAKLLAADVGLGEICVEHDAGIGAGYDDASYIDAGATVGDTESVIGAGGIVATVNAPRLDRDDPRAHGLGAEHIVIGVHDPLWQPEPAAKLAATGATVLALDLMPRITRAQSMDVLSSMATVAGYEAVLLAATRLPSLLPMMMTAAGTVQAARVLVLGAGVAGLQAIATARRLGAVVEGYDIRPAATEQIRSLGARAIEPTPASNDGGPTAEATEDEGGYARRQADDAAAAQLELLAPHVAAADAVITTAAVPGAPSPVLISAAMVEAMATGSVIVDLAAERGGNCEPTQADTEVTHGGVTVLGPTDLVSRSPRTASQLFAGNVVAFLTHLAPDGEVTVDASDEITAATLVSSGGRVVNQAVIDRMTS